MIFWQYRCVPVLDLVSPSKSSLVRIPESYGRGSYPKMPKSSRVLANHKWIFLTLKALGQGILEVKQIKRDLNFWKYNYKAKFIWMHRIMVSIKIKKNKKEGSPPSLFDKSQKDSSKTIDMKILEIQGTIKHKDTLKFSLQ